MSTASPTKKERRDQARRERIEREQAEAARVARRRRFTRLGAVLGAAVVVVAILVAVSSSGGGSSSSTGSSASSSAPVAGAAATRSLLNGIPQKGLTLGNPNAPVRVLEFADLQCPFCRDYTTGVMPGLVQKYVRTGKARMEFHTLAFIGPDSVRAGRVVVAAAQQNKLWNVADLTYHNQGTENSGWATDAKLRSIAAAVPGLDVNKVFAARDGAAVTAQLKAASDLATSRGVNETPTFLVGRGNTLKAVDAAGLPAALKAAVGS
jgi:protein-disulfide isomerase